MTKPEYQVTVLMSTPGSGAGISWASGGNNWAVRDGGLWDFPAGLAKLNQETDPQDHKVQ